MSNSNSNQNLDSTFDNTSNNLCICLFSNQSKFIQSVERLLIGNRDESVSIPTTETVKRRNYELNSFRQTEKLIEFIEQNKQQIDCLVFSNSDRLIVVVNKLKQIDILLPIIIVETEQYIKKLAEIEQESARLWIDAVIETSLYHRAEVRLYPTQLREIDCYIDLAINKFLTLKINPCSNSDRPNDEKNSEEEISKSLAEKQRRLTNKIKERLGYLGVYYKRDVNKFYRNLSTKEKKELNLKLVNSYRQILLVYFEDSAPKNKLIDEFVDMAFFADISTSKIIEIHMELIESFAYQLRIEGRSDDILLDYRLPLIDVVSHICEMYRRSIPQEDISLELLFGVK